MSWKHHNALGEQLTNQPVIFVGGKGGVGKTTTAAALACRYAKAQQNTLIVSTDPAHSLGDVLNVPLCHQAQQVAPHLFALELDPDHIVKTHFANVERTISAYANPDMLPKIREHLRLSKAAPGAQEAALLEAMCQQLLQAQQAGYAHVIFDTAPTGHTLRLFALPEMMSAWTDGLLTQQRRQAKLKSVAERLDVKQKTREGNGLFAAAPNDRWEQAVTVLEKRKHLFKQAAAVLHDRDQTAIVLVMTADTLPLAETRRSVKQLTQSGLTPAAIVINQLIDTQQRDPFWQRRAERQQHMLDHIEQTFRDCPLYPLALQQQDVRGFTQLSTLL